MGIRRERESEMMSCLEEEEEGQVKNNNAPMLKFGIKKSGKMEMKEGGNTERKRREREWGPCWVWFGQMAGTGSDFHLRISTFSSSCSRL